MFTSIMQGGDFFGQDLGMSNKDSTGPNKKKGSASRIKMGAIPADGRKVFFQFQFLAENIDKMSKFGKTDAFLEMAVSAEDDEWVTIHRTETIKKTTNPQWEKFQLTVNQLKADVSDRSLKISVNHWSKKG